MTKHGFTLIEILIVIAIIAIFASVIFVALDPLTRFKDARDADRWRDVNGILTAIKIGQVDNRGIYAYGVLRDAVNAYTLLNTNYMISNATTTTGCNATACSAVTGVDDCVNLQELVTKGYLPSLPVSPNGAGSWTGVRTGYYLTITTAPSFATSTIQISACEAENTSSISVAQ